MARVSACQGQEADGTKCQDTTADPRKLCPRHQRGRGWGGRFARTPTSPAHRTYRWRKLARRFREAWVRDHGLVCAGWRTPSHHATTLAVDHVLPVSTHPHLAYAWSNLQCLCAPCNARKSLSQREH